MIPRTILPSLSGVVLVIFLSITFRPTHAAWMLGQRHPHSTWRSSGSMASSGYDSPWLHHRDRRVGPGSTTVMTMSAKAHLENVSPHEETNELNESNIPVLTELQRLRQGWKTMRYWVCQRSNQIRNNAALGRRILSACLILTLVVITWIGTAEAVSGGRSGGSFQPKARSSVSKPALSRPMRYGTQYQPSRGSPIIIQSGPRIHYGADAWVTSSSSSAGTAVMVTRTSHFTPAEVTVLATTGALFLYGFKNNRDRIEDETTLSPLGPGATMASITVALNVPNCDDPLSILYTLRRLTLRTDTSSRGGVQDLVSEVALELLRQENSIISAQMDSQHFSNSASAQRSFQMRSVNNRSKFDRESVNKFGDADNWFNNRITTPSDKDNASVARATAVVVTLNIAIEGDSTRLPALRSRADVRQALSRIASDAKVEECLLSGEVLWSPDGPNEILSQEELYSKYPELLPL